MPASVKQELLIPSPPEAGEWRRGQELGRQGEKTDLLPRQEAESESALSWGLEDKENWVRE